MIAVVTGASSGIGKATASALLAAGYTVFCLSRTPCPLAGVQSIACDITNTTDIARAFAQIDHLDLLVNNAGFGISGAVEFTDAEDMQRQFALNFFAQVAVIQAALPLLKQSHGRILNVSSAAAIFPIPFQSFYSASKAAIESLTGALRLELAPFGVEVCALRLGDVQTGFTTARQKSFRGDDLYGGAIARSLAVMEKDEQTGMSPAVIAKAIVKTAGQAKLPPIKTVGAKYKLFCLLAKGLPTSAVHALIRKIYT